MLEENYVQFYIHEALTKKQGAKRESRAQEKELLLSGEGGNFYLFLPISIFCLCTWSGSFVFRFLLLLLLVSCIHF